MPQTKHKRRRFRKTIKGGISARYYYPQNMLVQDPQRDMQTSQIKGGGTKYGGKGGCGCGMKGGTKYGGKKNHTRKYLRKGGAGFFNNFGTTTGASAAAAQILGVPKTPVEIKPSFLV